MKFRHTYTYFFIFIFLVSCTAASNREPEEKDQKNKYGEEISAITWLDSVINFGKMNMGDTISLRFRFKNTGTVPLVIKTAETSCSCTIVYPVASAIPPGAVGEIRAMFDTRKSIVGFVRKTILVGTNTVPSQKVLLYGGEITGHKAIAVPSPLK